MKKSIWIIIITVFISVLIYVAVGFARGSYISDKYVYNGTTDNWKVKLEVLETGESSYSLTTSIEYVGSDEPENARWKVESESFGTGGTQELSNGKIFKKEPLDIDLKGNEDYKFSVEWDKDFEEKVVLKLSEKN